jgi:hypothetical protein
VRVVEEDGLQAKRGMSAGEPEAGESSFYLLPRLTRKPAAGERGRKDDEPVFLLTTCSQGRPPAADRAIRQVCRNGPSTCASDSVPIGVTSLSLFLSSVAADINGTCHPVHGTVPVNLCPFDRRRSQAEAATIRQHELSRMGADRQGQRTPCPRTDERRTKRAFEVPGSFRCPSSIAQRDDQVRADDPATAVGFLTRT